MKYLLLFFCIFSGLPFPEVLMVQGQVAKEETIDLCICKMEYSSSNNENYLNIKIRLTNNRNSKITIYPDFIDLMLKNKNQSVIPNCRVWDGKKHEDIHFTKTLKRIKVKKAYEFERKITMSEYCWERADELIDSLYTISIQYYDPKSQQTYTSDEINVYEETGVKMHKY